MLHGDLLLSDCRRRQRAPRELLAWPEGEFETIRRDCEWASRASRAALREEHVRTQLRVDVLVFRCLVCRQARVCVQSHHSYVSLGFVRAAKAPLPACATFARSTSLIWERFGNAGAVHLHSRTHSAYGQQGLASRVTHRRSHVHLSWPGQSCRSAMHCVYPVFC